MYVLKNMSRLTLDTILRAWLSLASVPNTLTEVYVQVVDWQSDPREKEGEKRKQNKMECVYEGFEFATLCSNLREFLRNLQSLKEWKGMTIVHQLLFHVSTLPESLLGR